jgi:hypothetical protein
MRHRHWNGRFAAALVASAVVVGQAALPASVSAKPVETKLRLVPIGLIDPTTGDWEYDFGVAIGGLLTHGPEATCASGREVSVFRDEPNGPDTLIGSRKTDAIFHVAIVKIRNPDPATVAGTYYAKATAATKRHGSKKLKCQAAKSKLIHVVAPDFTTLSG